MPDYEHFWEVTQLPDGGKIYRTNHRRTDMTPHRWEYLWSFRAMRRSNPQPNTPEDFYRRERFKEAPVRPAPPTITIRMAEEATPTNTALTPDNHPGITQIRVPSDPMCYTPTTSGEGTPAKD